VHLLLREINRDVPAEVQKWNILDAMRSVSMAWESIVHAVIQNCFVKCGFGSRDWVELQSHIDYPSTFEEFLNANKLVPTTTD
jgi:hypothetical protein